MAGNAYGSHRAPPARDRGPSTIRNALLAAVVCGVLFGFGVYVLIIDPIVLAGLSCLGIGALWLLRVPRPWAVTPLSLGTAHAFWSYAGIERLPGLAAQPWLWCAGLALASAFWWTWAVTPSRSWRARVAWLGTLACLFVVVQMLVAAA